MTLPGPLLAFSTLILLLFVALRPDTAPATDSTALMIAVLAMAQWQPVKMTRLRSWLLAPLLAILGLALASYLFPEYWLSIMSWDAWLMALVPAGEPLPAAYLWRPPVLMVLTLGLLAINLLLGLRLALGSPILLVIAGLTLLSQAIDQLRPADAWVLEHASPTLLLLATGCLFLAQVIALVQRYRQRLRDTRRPLLIGLGLVLAALLFWHQQSALEDRRQRLDTAQQSRALAKAFERENDDHLRAMRRFASFWELRDDAPPIQLWLRQASLYHNDYRYFLNIAFIEPSSTIVRVYPPEDNRSVLGARLFDDQPEGRGALGEALLYGREGSTGAIDLLQGVPGIIHYLPVRRESDGDILGAAAMVVSLPEMIDTLFGSIDTQTLSLRLRDGDRVLASIGSPDGWVGWRHRFTIDVGGQPLTLEALPGHTQLLMQRARLPEIGLLVGLTLAYLLYLVLYAYQRLASQHRAARHTNQELRREVEARSVLQREVEWLARHDDLTGLPNRRLFMETLHANRDALPLSVLICDVDHFKCINDHMGHLEGDRYLKRLGDIGRNVIEPSGGLFTRYGGEEFVVCLPHHDAESARRLAERLRRRVSEAALLHHDGTSLSVSIGLATQVEGELDVSVLMQVADEALYDAKSSGRDRVVSGRRLTAPRDTLSDATEP